MVGGYRKGNKLKKGGTGEAQIVNLSMIERKLRGEEKKGISV